MTICVQGGESLLREVVDGEMRLSEWGQIAAESWEGLDVRYSYLSLDAWVIRPNHLHGIIALQEQDVPGKVGRGGSQTAPTPAIPTKRILLGRLVGAFKTVSTKRINQLRGMPGLRFWQRYYREHVMRDERSLDRIREPVWHNPARWTEDQLHPDAPSNAFSQGRPAAL